MTHPTEGDPGELTPEAVPVCPRHPDRESYVRCQRCERPVCPQCQRPAAVGIQCVDCVRNQAKGQRTARTVFGGSAGGGRPWVTQGVIAACVVVYLLQVAPGSILTSYLDFVPALAESEPWRFLTSAFAHSPSRLPIHIGFNMYALWLIGPYLEELLGRVRFLALYLLSAVGGSVAFLAAASPTSGTAWVTGAVGASGAVFGLFAALVVVNRRLGRSSQAIFGVMLVNLMIGFFPGLNIAWQAHLGGLVTGATVAAVLAFAPVGVRRTAIQTAGVVGIAVLLLVVTLAKFATLPAGL